MNENKQNENKQVYLTTYALKRVLKGLAQRIVPDDLLADAVVQVHVQQYPIHEAWTNFLMRNCVRCAKEPHTCDFLNPTAANVAGAAVPGGARAAVATNVENGMIITCPAIQERSSHKE
jgi:hypothetical protein